MRVSVIQIDTQNIIIITGTKRHFTATQLPENSPYGNRIKLSKFSRSFAICYKIEETENGLKIYHCRKFKGSRKNTGTCNVRIVHNMCRSYEVINGYEMEMEALLETFDEREKGRLDRLLKFSQIFGNFGQCISSLRGF